MPEQVPWHRFYALRPYDLSDPFQKPHHRPCVRPGESDEIDLGGTCAVLRGLRQGGNEVSAVESGHVDVSDEQVYPVRSFS